ncbi:beta-crystallin S-1-like [Pundamilia nyererei]|uniref:Beta-crystallin S-1-like n=3 Tax=Haplochromini TaxID=319058 RepID=A0A9Y3RTX5_9CICH|nr:beta-crystallin S-1-like [Maylandia zebra]XP_005746370.1 PREDICTED: beta-crystallin S-1-like [Pundamilia nyererei]XP_005933483.1 gamma-crystallin S-1 [Haplochromis burtoni]XP_026000634.1 gamma-crystallin S-1-like [Astatotilapia calliptera]
MEKIVFFEDRDFKGKSYDCKGDSANLHGYIRRCNSVKVEGGWWVLYERNNFTGYQYVIGPGEYNNYSSWMGFNDCVRSCRIIRNPKGPYKLMLYERLNFIGQSLELTESIKSVQDKWLRQEVQSCKVLEGTWVFFEHPNFSGRQYLLEKGEYHHCSEWGALKAVVGSIRRIIKA